MKTRVTVLFFLFVLIGFGAGFVAGLQSITKANAYAAEATIGKEVLEVVGQYSTDYSYGSGETGFIVRDGDRTEFVPKGEVSGVMVEPPKFLRRITKGKTTTIEPLFESSFQPVS
jgi:hypothetical protein